MTSVADFLSEEPSSESAETVLSDPRVDPEATVPFTVTDRTVETPSGETRPVCQEPGCGKACRKRKNRDDFFPYCPTHNALHAGTGTGRPKSQEYQQLEEQRRTAAKTIENNVIGWFQPIQVGLMASNDVYCATALGHEIPPIAKALGDISMDFPWLQTALGTVDKWTALSLLVFHMVKLGTMIGVHHEWIPYDGPVKFLVPPPDSVKITPNGDSPS